jgi:hypothetical protein
MVFVIMISNNRDTRHCIRYGKRCDSRVGSKTCPHDPGNGEVVNAVEIENIIRRETNEKERKEDPKHVQ